MNNLGELVKSLRVNKGVTQGQLAIKASLKRDDIKNIERGIILHPRADKLDRIARALDANVAVLREAAGYIPESKRVVETPEVLLERLRLAQPQAIPVYTEFKVHAGALHEEPVEYIYRSRERPAGKNIEAYIVNGECLSPKVEHGDIVIVDRDRPPEPGNLLICMVDEQIIVGKYSVEEYQKYLINNEEKLPLRDIKVCAVIIQVEKRLV